MSAQPPESLVPPSRALSTRPLIVLALLLVIGLIGFGGYRASEYQGMQTLRTDAGHRLDLFGAAVDGIVNRYAHIPATIQLSEEVLALMDELHHDLGKTIVMVTHDPKAAARASRMIHLEKGVLVDDPSDAH